MMGERETFDSWKEISDYLKRDPRTCQRYERDLGLPVHRLDGSLKARVFAYKDEIDDWRTRKLLERQGSVSRLLFLVRSKPLAALLTIVPILGLGALIYLSVLGLSGRRSDLSHLSIAVLPVQSAPGLEVADAWTPSLPVMLIDGLSGSNYYAAVSYDRTLAALKEMDRDPAAPFSTDDLEEFAGKTGATHVVICVVLKAGRTRVAALTVRRRRNAEAFTSRFDIKDEAGIVRTVDLMVDQIKRDLGVTRTTQAGDFDALGMPVTTSSLKAFRLYNEGRRFHVSGDYARSARIMRMALRRDPEFALAWRSLAASLDSLGAEAEAMACLRKALAFSRNASMPERLFIRTDYFHQRSELKRALQTSREWLSLYPDDTQAMLFTGRALIFEEDPEGGKSVLEEGLRRGDRNPFMFFYAAIANTSLGLFDEASRVRERGLSIHPANRLIATAGVIDAIVQGRHDRARSQLEQISAEEPHGSTELKFGDVLLLGGDFRGAELHYSGIRPPSDHALARLARLALAEGRYGRAAELAAEAEDHALLAHIESRRGRLSEALGAASKALKKAEEQGDCYTELVALHIKGAIEALAGRLEAAKACAVGITEGSARGLGRGHERAGLCLGGLIASAEGRHGLAEKEFEAAVGLLPRDVPYLDDRPYQIGVVAGMHATVLYAAGQECEKAGKQALALGHYLKLMGLNGGRLQHPDLYALSHYAAGRIRHDQGDLEGARESLTRFLELWKNADPGLPEVEDARKRLAALT